MKSTNTVDTVVPGEHGKPLHKTVFSGFSSVASVVEPVS